MKIVSMGIAILALIFFGQPDTVISMPVKLLVFLIGFGLIALLTWLQQRRREQENQKQPVVTVKARVVSRRTETIGSGRNRQVIWFLKFRPVEGGSALEFQVSEAEASRYDEGEEALLQYQGWKYLGFRRYIFEDTPRNQPQEELPAKKHVDEPQETDEDDGILTHELED